MLTRLFNRDRSTLSPTHADLHGSYERLITLVDFLAALCFVIGSVMFFYETLLFDGTWMFLIGSVFFCVSPTLKVIREFHLASLPQGLASAVEEDA